MNISVDIETYKKTEKGYEPTLDATEFTVGVICRENLSTKAFYKKQELWEWIINKGKSEAKRGKILNVYGHYHIYDFYGYANISDTNLIISSHNPFIVTYTLNYEECKQYGIKTPKLQTEFKSKGQAQEYAIRTNTEIIEENGKYYNYKRKEIIKFLDTMAIYRMALKGVGKVIGHEKTEMPKEEQIKNKTDIKLKVTPYCKNDTIVTIKAVHKIKELLKEQGIQLKRIYTMPQIAIAYIINQLKKDDNQVQGFWFNKERGMIQRPKLARNIHQAYRGGRVEAYTLGITENVTYIDKNSLYGKMAGEINFPQLTTEKKIYNPLSYYSQKEILSKIGLSRAILENKTEGIGLLQIRTPNGNYTPQKDQYMIGTWTNEELLKAKKEGYKILDIEWTITYQQTSNPLKRIMEECYQQRLQSKLKSYFYKSIMNFGIGKFAQTKTGKEMIIDSIEEQEKYIKRSYDMLRGIAGTENVIYQKKIKGRKKPFYNPIIATLITAKGRTTMYDELSKIPRKDLVYTDTDSILFTGNHLKKFSLSEELGDFKIATNPFNNHEVIKNKTAIVYGRKTYAIENKIMISGAKGRTTLKQFKDGEIENLRMNTLFNTQDGTQLGTFRKITRDLKKQLQNYKEIQEDLQLRPILMDMDIQNINHFLPILRKIQY